jgi:hypothetical protein
MAQLCLLAAGSHRRPAAPLAGAVPPQRRLGAHPREGTVPGHRAICGLHAVPAREVVAAPGMAVDRTVECGNCAQAGRCQGSARVA